jgi:hypothetical protein
MSVCKYRAFIFLDQPPPWVSRTDIQHWDVNRAWTRTCSMNMDMAAWIWACSLDVDMQPGHGHAAWTRTCALTSTLIWAWTWTWTHRNGDVYGFGHQHGRIQLVSWDRRVRSMSYANFLNNGKIQEISTLRQVCLQQTLQYMSLKFKECCSFNFK